VESSTEIIGTITSPAAIVAVDNDSKTDVLGLVFPVNASSAEPTSVSDKSEAESSTGVAL